MHILTNKFKQVKKSTLESEALETETSVQAGAQCEIKSRFFKNWTKREIVVNLEDELLYIICDQTGRKKHYPLSQVSYTRNTNENIIKLKVCPTRSYEVRMNKLLEQVLKDIDYYHSFKKIRHETYQLHAPQPRKIHYEHSFPKPHKQQPENKIVKLESLVSKKQSYQKQKVKPLQDYQRQVSYIKHEDWKRDHKNGLLFINKQKKHLIPKMISYTAKKVMSSGSFVNINFPTFAMKPESALESYCKCLSAVPLILNNIQSSPLERMKAFNAILLSMSIQLNDIEKPFNAILGQTFQGEIGGYPAYAEQISTKPSISCFLFMGKGYKLYGNLQLKADIGLNQAVGVFHGSVTLQFEDGGKIIGIMPKGVMSGVLFGDTTFGPTGAVYSYDLKNKLVCSYETKKGDTMMGQIGKLKEPALHKFLKNIKQKGVDQYSHVQEKEYETILSKIHVVYTDSVSYDGKVYFSYSNKHNLPIRMTKHLPNHEHLLPSDSSYRQDIKLRKLNNIKDSQELNDDLEKQEQRLRKIRKTKLANIKSLDSLHKFH